MNKIACVLLCTLSICVLLTACNSTHRYSYRQPAENIVQITYIDENVEIEIPSEKIEELLMKIESLSCKKYWNNRGVALSYPYICILYIDGSCEVISSEMNYYENAGEKNDRWEYFDADAFSEILNSCI